MFSRSRNNSTALVLYGGKNGYRFDYAPSRWPVTMFRVGYAPTDHRPTAPSPVRLPLSTPTLPLTKNPITFDPAEESLADTAGSLPSANELAEYQAQESHPTKSPTRQGLRAEQEGNGRIDRETERGAVSDYRYPWDSPAQHQKRGRPQKTKSQPCGQKNPLRKNHQFSGKPSLELWAIGEHLAKTRDCDLDSRIPVSQIEPKPLVPGVAVFDHA